MRLGSISADLPLRIEPLRLGLRSVTPILALIGLSFLPLLFYLPFLDEPFLRDEGVYSVVARMILDGKLPYRDVFDHKPPVVYGWYALSFGLFGEGVWAPRLLAALALGLTTPLAFAAGRSLFRTNRAGWVAAAAFALSIGLPLLGANANPEAFMLLPMTASLVAFIAGWRRQNSIAWFLLAGIFGGLAILTKPVALWNWLALLLAALVLLRGKAQGRQRWLASAGLLGGLAASLLLAAIPFALMGALGDFFYANVTYNVLYVDEGGWSERMAHFGMGTLRFALVAAPWVVLASIGAFICYRRGQQWQSRLLLAWGLASMVGIASSGRFFVNYYVQILPAIALLTVPAIGALAQSWHNPTLRLSTYALFAVAAAVTLLLNLPAYEAAGPQERHAAKFGEANAAWNNQSMALAAYLAERTGPTDLVYNYGRQTQIYFYADRASPTRYVYDRSFWLDEGTFQQAMADLQLQNPTYFVDTLLAPMFPDYEKYHPQALMAFLQQHYEYKGRIYYADVYQLKEPTLSSSASR